MSLHKNNVSKPHKTLPYWNALLPRSVLILFICGIYFHTDIALFLYDKTHSEPQVPSFYWLTSSLKEKLLWYYPLGKNLEPAAGELVEPKEASPFRSVGAFQGIQLSSNRFLKIPSVHDFNFQKDFTLSFWFIPPESFSPSGHPLKNIFWVGNTVTPANPYFSLWYHNQSGAEKLHISSAMGKANLPYHFKGKQFYQLVLSYKADKRSLNLFINGEEISFSFYETPAGALSAPDPSFMFQVAQGYAPSTNYSAIYGGLVLWGRTLAPTEVQTLFSWSQDVNVSDIHDYTEDIWLSRLANSHWIEHMLWNYPLHHNTVSALDSAIALLEDRMKEISISSPVPGFIRKGMELSYSRFLQFPRPQDLDLRRSISLGFWVVPIEASRSLKNIFWIGNPNKSETPYLSLWYNGASDVLHLSSVLGKTNISYKMYPKQLYYFLLISDLENSKFRFFINGQELPILISDHPVELTKIAQHLPAVNPDEDKFYFARGITPETGLHGLYGDITLWRKALNQTEIQTLTATVLREESSFVSELLVLKKELLRTTTGLAIFCLFLAYQSWIFIIVQKYRIILFNILFSLLILIWLMPLHLIPSDDGGYFIEIKNLSECLQENYLCWPQTALFYTKPTFIFVVSIIHAVVNIFKEITPLEAIGILSLLSIGFMGGLIQSIVAKSIRHKNLGYFVAFTLFYSSVTLWANTLWWGYAAFKACILLMFWHSLWIFMQMCDGCLLKQMAGYRIKMVRYFLQIVFLAVLAFYIHLSVIPFLLTGFFASMIVLFQNIRVRESLKKFFAPIPLSINGFYVIKTSLLLMACVPMIIVGIGVVNQLAVQDGHIPYLNAYYTNYMESNKGHWASGGIKLTETAFQELKQHFSTDQNIIKGLESLQEKYFSSRATFFFEMEKRIGRDHIQTLKTKLSPIIEIQRPSSPPLLYRFTVFLYYLSTELMLFLLILVSFLSLWMTKCDIIRNLNKYKEIFFYFIILISSIILISLSPGVKNLRNFFPIHIALTLCICFLVVFAIEHICNHIKNKRANPIMLVLLGATFMNYIGTSLYRSQCVIDTMLGVGHQIEQLVGSDRPIKIFFPRTDRLVWGRYLEEVGLYPYEAYVIERLKTKLLSYERQAYHLVDFVEVEHISDAFSQMGSHDYLITQQIPLFVSEKNLIHSFPLFTCTRPPSFNYMEELYTISYIEWSFSQWKENLKSYYCSGISRHDNSIFIYQSKPIPDRKHVF
ncbi:MAG: hypothetical protein HQM12_22310 [SAR324 cluster bacterium]|nr:hypothetical protein [SAR324 cluster bacterium]